MGNILGAWRGGFSVIIYLLLAVSVIVFMNHRNFAEPATETRRALSEKILTEIIPDPEVRQELIQKNAAIPVHTHTIGEDPPLSRAKNLDTPYVDTLAATAVARPEAGLEGKVQEFRTLFHQQMLPSVLRAILPVGLMGLFCVLVILMIISTDSSRIFSASMTLSQDLVLPLLKKPLTSAQHINMIRAVTYGVAGFFLVGSVFMSQIDYVSLFVRLMYGIWAAGAGVVVMGGLYTRFGTAQGAWAALFTGSGMMVGGALLQRVWATVIYPWLDGRGWDDEVGGFLETVSGPFNPWVVWQMDPYKFPINAIEMGFLAMLSSIAVYVGVSWLTCREKFNLDRMLHRGKYNLDGFVESTRKWTLKNFPARIIGITNEFTVGDKIISWAFFLHGFVIIFGVFVVTVIWNAIDPWPVAWWGNYFFIFSLVIPGILAAITAVWFFIGGVIDLRRMFRDLAAREINDLDDGRVEGHMSLADKAQLEEIERKAAPDKPPKA